MLKKLLVLLLTLVFLLSLVLITGYLMTVYRPGAYNPAILNRQQQEDVKYLGDKKVEEFHNKLFKEKLFSIGFNQNLLNSLLLHDEVASYTASKLPRSADLFSQPQVHLANGRIEVMGQTKYKDVNVILTITFKPEITDDGLLKISLLPVKVGAVKIPDKIITEILDDLARKIRNHLVRHNSPKNKELSSDYLNKILAVIPDLVMNRQVTQEPIFCLFGKNTEAKITNIEVSDGIIKLDFQPIQK